ncbi:MAG: NACHT domain-containing protein, partial [Chloroflexota bacterium]
MTDKSQNQSSESGDTISVGNISDSQNVIVGNHNQINVNTTPPPINTTDKTNQRNHNVLRQAVHLFWVKGVLHSSLYHEVRIRLGLDQRADAVDYPWDLILQQTDGPDVAIDDRKQLTDIYDELNGQMLILGAPGSGKTTTLLMLAESLLARAERNPEQPTPVVFNLSSWQDGQSLAEWLVEELNLRYQMPKKVSQGWVERDELVLLLDGLDEVGEARRDACVAAINEFRSEHVVSLVVCSRIDEYESFTSKLRLSGAVIVRPLTRMQINAYIAELGTYGVVLAAALVGNAELRELAKTPLMLSVMAFAFEGQEVNEEQRLDTKAIFDKYIERMFVHRELPHLYTPKQTLGWLHWLAGRMVKRGQTLFLIERLQPDWLTTEKQMNLYQQVVRFSGRLLVGLVIGLIGILSTGLVLLLTMSLTGFFDSLTVVVIGGLISVLSLGLINYLTVMPAIDDDLLWWEALQMDILDAFNLRQGRFETYTKEKNIRTEYLGWITQNLTNFWKKDFIIDLFALFTCDIVLFIRYCILRILIYYDKHTPWNYARFLDYTVSRLFLYKVGGGYVFVHR